jgi:hypothetical protein
LYVVRSSRNRYALLKKLLFMVMSLDPSSIAI